MKKRNNLILILKGAPAFLGLLVFMASQIAASSVAQGHLNSVHIKTCSPEICIELTSSEVSQSILNQGLFSDKAKITITRKGSSEPAKTLEVENVFFNSKSNQFYVHNWILHPNLELLIEPKDPIIRTFER